jgi:hypothetical protein
MSSLTDRTDDIRIVSAPMEFKASKVWRDSMDQLDMFIYNLERMEYIPIEDYTLFELNSNQPEWRKLLESLVNGDTVTLLKLNGGEPRDEINPMPALSLSQLTKYFLIFCRKVSYDWYYEKCESGINDYNEIRNRLLDNTHLALPELKVPTYDESKMLPFVKEAVEAFTQWRDNIYDIEAEIVQQLPMRALVNADYSNYHQGSKRRILLSTDDADKPRKEVTLNDLEYRDVYLTDEIAKKLREIKTRYDIVDAWEKSQVALEAMSDKFDSEN